MSGSSNDVIVYGIDVDPETRCAHWHSSLDIVAIKFKCCGEFYSCYECHNAVADHAAQQWLAEEFSRLAILCGRCRSQLKISEYLTSSAACPRCSAAFNPGCAKHYDLYFRI